METFNSPLDAFAHWVNTTPNKTFLRQPINRVFKEYTYKEADQEIRKIASALHGMGISKGSHVALLSKNCAHWIMADLAIMMAECISIPIYPTLGAESIHEILVHSESKAIIVGKLDDYSQQKSGIPDIPIIGVKLYDINEQYEWDQLVASNEPIQGLVEQKPEDLMTIMYTSGTTGSPKGVMHTVGTFNTLLSTARDVIKLPNQPRYFSYLPMTHIAERAGIELSAVYRGAEVSFPESLETFGEDLALYSPTPSLVYPEFGKNSKKRFWKKCLKRNWTD